MLLRTIQAWPYGFVFESCCCPVATTWNFKVLLSAHRRYVTQLNNFLSPLMPVPKSKSTWAKLGWTLPGLSLCTGRRGEVCIDLLTTEHSNFIVESDLVLTSVERCQAGKKRGFLYKVKLVKWMWKCCCNLSVMCTYEVGLSTGKCDSHTSASWL